MEVQRNERLANGKRIEGGATKERECRKTYKSAGKLGRWGPGEGIGRAAKNKTDRHKSRAPTLQRRVFSDRQTD